jgi:hypothetical protein
VPPYPTDVNPNKPGFVPRSADGYQTAAYIFLHILAVFIWTGHGIVDTRLLQWLLNLPPAQPDGGVWAWKLAAQAYALSLLASSPDAEDWAETGVVSGRGRELVAVRMWFDTCTAMRPVIVGGEGNGEGEGGGRARKRMQWGPPRAMLERLELLEAENGELLKILCSRENLGLKIPEIQAVTTTRWDQ